VPRLSGLLFGCNEKCTQKFTQKGHKWPGTEWTFCPVLSCSVVTHVLVVLLSYPFACLVILCLVLANDGTKNLSVAFYLLFSA